MNFIQVWKNFEQYKYTVNKVNNCDLRKKIFKKKVQTNF